MATGPEECRPLPPPSESATTFILGRQGYQVLAGLLAAATGPAIAIDRGKWKRRSNQVHLVGGPAPGEFNSRRGLCRACVWDQPARLNLELHNASTCLKNRLHDSRNRHKR